MTGALPPKAAWHDSELLECTMVIPEAPDVATFVFRAPSGAWFDYRAGQFVTLELPVPGGPVERTYTISTSPSRPLNIAVTVKAQAGSTGSRWMLDNLRKGMRLKAYGPAGIFTLPDQPDGRYLLIGAGSGITPMMSMATYLYDYSKNTDARLIACARRPSELIFRDRLIQMSRRVPGLRLSFAVTEEEPYDVWTGYLGRFNQLMLSLMAPDYLDRDIYCCGPEPFMQMVRDSLNALGYDMDRYNQESFGAPVACAAEEVVPDDVVPDEAATAEVTFARSGVVVPCFETDTILAMARAEGVRIPSGCTFGVCGTCKVKKRAGEVHMVHNGGIAQEDIDAGYILACCSNPIGHVEIEA
ncbi:3-ketosteroid-9-alpha-monooxygenase, ferredoxin reductase component [Roseibaca ekhonensis]|uniref:3-ketosteroid-9-alpha-monooxygenase, ferredoxin reductase component n=1 Tax=Roseinatronobacter ekhonensis TaxID=254356 RepID=A0A3B0MVU8_9RHOB|nr:hybrid-cluster NAD(P)-dependent oxidoreductase [Roseibaca ekhonensis]SUZ32854.1 3-ketosteroid-9-alpha-monooxygenase, ferredoxin reductase component [Roseibaca ekhonensis]